MKNRFIFLILTAAALLSCRNYLTVAPQGTFIPKTDEDFASLLHTIVFDIEAGAGDYITGNYEMVAWLEAISDNLDANLAVPTSMSSLPVYAGEMVNTFSGQYYKSIYAAIKDCNLVIDNLGDRDTELARKACSAAYAIKGICYYNLMRIFCQPFDGGTGDDLPGMPLVYHYDPDDHAIPDRGTLRKTYEYTLELLQKSIDYHISDAMFLFTENIARVYLARTYFWGGDYTNAAQVCEELMAEPDYELTPSASYAAMIQSKYDRSGEVIFRDMVNDGLEHEYYRSNYLRIPFKARPVNRTLVELFGDKPADDVRWGVMCDAQRYNNKMLCYRIRVSEILLMLAECYVHEGGASNEAKALGLLNDLRRNRITGVADYTMATLPQPDPSALIRVDARGVLLTPLLSAIFDERRKELYLEGDRWFELKRNGRPEWWVIYQYDMMKYSTRKYLYTAPMGYRDIMLSEGKMVQNPGYEELM